MRRIAHLLLAAPALGWSPWRPQDAIKTMAHASAHSFERIVKKAGPPRQCCRDSKKSAEVAMSRVAQKIALDLLHAAAPTGVSPRIAACRAEDGRLGRAQRQRRCQRAEAWPQAWQRRRSSLRHRSRTATVQGGAAHRRSPARRRPRAPARAPATPRTSWSMPWEIPSRGRASRTRAPRIGPSWPTL